MLGGQPNHGWQHCFPPKLHAGGSDFILYDGSDLKTYLFLTGILPVGFILLQYSVLCTFESLSLLYLFYFYS